MGPGVGIASSAIALNLVLALVKISTGVVGNSYALVADGFESTADIFSSLIVVSGLRISSRPPDENHPYGHGKAESLAALAVAIFLIVAAIFIAVQAIGEIRTPHQAPAWYTLLILGLIILAKEALYRRMHQVGTDLDSSSLRSDAWHHRSDAITSLAAFVGISIALVGGDGYEAADDWAALFACGIILVNGGRMLRPAMDEVMDASASPDMEQRAILVAQSVDGVVRIEKCRIRKSGLGYLMDVHVEVPGDVSVRDGHAVGHRVKDQLLNSSLSIVDVVVHIEPAKDRAADEPLDLDAA